MWMLAFQGGLSVSDWNSEEKKVGLAVIAIPALRPGAM
jgi:hypothetical protein